MQKQDYKPGHLTLELVFFVFSIIKLLGSTFSFTDWEWQTPPSPQTVQRNRDEGPASTYSASGTDVITVINKQMTQFFKDRDTEMLPLLIASE